MHVIEPIRLAFDTAATPARAWAFITDPDLVRQWFAEVTPLGPVGSPYRIDFGDGSLAEGRVLEIEPGGGFSHEWAWRDGESIDPTVVRWQVVPLPDGGARIELLHDGWAEAGGDAATRDDHEAYWSGYLDDLHALLDGPSAEPLIG